jgi:hypothetical protein
MEEFKTGKGFPRGEHDPDLFMGTEKFFKPGYVSDLVTCWIPSLDNARVQEKLQEVVVADVGCGHGISTIILTKEYP